MRSINAYYLGINLLLVIFDIGYLNEVTPKCDGPEPDVCEYDVSLEMRYTNIDYYEQDGVITDMFPLQALEPGQLSRMECDGDPVHEFVGSLPEDSTVPTVDSTIKLALMMNGQIPGPPIVVYEGQEVVLRVKNDMINEVVTIHFHGIEQRGTPWMDGARGVSQCPINPGESFTYRFRASKAGTSWYHAHMGTQRTEGLFAPLVVLNRPDPFLPEALTFEKDFYMMVSDFYNESSYSLNHRFTEGGKDYVLPSWKECWESNYRQQDHVFLGFDPFYSALVNGKGVRYERYTENLETPNYPLETFYVTKGGKYRFRVISTVMTFPFRISIDGHILYVIASDGNDVEPFAVQSFVINSGERFDFYIEADDPDDLGLYWIRVSTIDMIFTGSHTAESYGIINGTHVEAILSYANSSSTQPYSTPVSFEDSCTIPGQYSVLNCPFENFPLGINENCTCKKLTDLRSVKNEITFPMEENSIETVINSLMVKPNPNIRIIYPSFNGIWNIMPTKPPMIFPSTWKESAVPCEDHACEGLCKCTHHIKYPLHTVVQMVLSNYHYDYANRTLSPYNHPIHIHGIYFQVVKVGFPRYGDLGIFYGTNMDMKCTDDSTCDQVVWSNPNWAGGNIPDIIESGAPWKDTVFVPAGGYVVIRFRTENPGYWFMHCHMEQHNMRGMSLILQVGEPEDMPPKPPGMSTCGDFSWDGKSTQVEVEDVIVVEDDTGTVLYLGIIIILCIVCLFLLLKIIKRSKEHWNTEIRDEKIHLLAQ